MASYGSAAERHDVGDGLISVYDWHDWFAWHPVWLPEAGWVWMRRLERRFSVKNWKTGDRTVVRWLRVPLPAPPPSCQDSGKD